MAVPTSTTPKSSYNPGYVDPQLPIILSSRAHVVCHIQVSAMETCPGNKGTGFLIGKDLILTNNHVVPSIESARRAKAIFFYTTEESAPERVEVDLAPDDFFYTSPKPDSPFQAINFENLDFTIVSIHSHPRITTISKFAFSIFGTPSPEQVTRAPIIHHPKGGVQRGSFLDNRISKIGGLTIHYTTATEAGSSGAPVMDEGGNLIALHRSVCVDILNSLLKERVLIKLLATLFPGVNFIYKEFHWEKITCKGFCAIIEGAPLYVFSDGPLKGDYYHEGRTFSETEGKSSPVSLFKLIQQQYPQTKDWILQFLNSHLPPEEQIEGYHKNCSTGVLIKVINDHLKRAGALPFIQARYEESQKSLSEQLKESYREHDSHFPLIGSPARFPIKTVFTQLCIVSTSKKKKKQNELDTGPQEIKKLIMVSDLFENQDNKPIKNILVLGKAGVGKSGLCQKMAYDWAEEGLFENKFSLVYHLKLRDLNSIIQKCPYTNNSPERWMSRIVSEMIYSGAHVEEIVKELKSHPEKILLIFDGWDEASGAARQALQKYFLTSKTHCLFTSRPNDIPQIPGRFNLVVENIGFDQTQIVKYTNQFFALTKCESGDAFLAMLRTHSNLLSMAQTPMLLQILCDLWQKGEREFPQTVSSLISKSAYVLFEWEQKKKGLETERKGQQENSALHEVLGKIALKGLESGGSNISQEHVDPVLFQKLMTTGLLLECGQGVVKFLHQIYQQYSIARYLSSLSKIDNKQVREKLSRFVQRNRYLPRFRDVISMLAGCMWMDSNKNVKTLEMFFEWLYGGHKELVGSYQTELVLSCLDECRSVDLERRIWERYKIAEFVEGVLVHEGTRECLIRWMALSDRVFMQVLQHITKGDSPQMLAWFLKHLGSGLKEEAIPLVLDLLQKALNHQEEEIRSAASSALIGIAQYVKEETVSQFLDLIHVVLANEDSRVRLEALVTIAKMSAHLKEKSALPIKARIQIVLLREIHAAFKIKTPGALENVLSLREIHAAFQIKTLLALENVLNFLGELGPYLSTEAVALILACVQKALEDEDGKVSMRALHVLRKLSLYVKENGLISFLGCIRTALENNEDDSTREFAVVSLGEVCLCVNEETLAPFLSCIQLAFSDEYESVRKAAAKALGTLGSHANKKVLSLLLDWVQSATKDGDDWVRQASLSALGALGPYVNTEILTQCLGYIRVSLEDEYEWVRKAAIEALGELAPFVREDVMIQFLGWIQISARDECTVVRHATALTLKKLAPFIKENLISQFLNRIQIALSDDDKFVRRAAAMSLGESSLYLKGGILARCLDCFQIAFRDQDLLVQKAAAEGVGKLGPCLTAEAFVKVLGWLQTALNSVNDWAGSSHVKEILMQILASVQIALNDEDQERRVIATLALKELAPFIKRETAFPFLGCIQKAQGDKEVAVRASAAWVLGELDPHIPEDTLTQFLGCFHRAFRDENPKVRCAAMAIGKLVPYVHKSIGAEILSLVQTIALNDGDNWAQVAAVEVIGKHNSFVDEKVLKQIFGTIPADGGMDLAIYEMIQKKVAMALGKKNSNLSVFSVLQYGPTAWINRDLNQYAVNALETLGRYANVKPIIQCLKDVQMLLSSEYVSLRLAVLRSLMQLSPYVKGAITPFLNCVQTALRDKDPRVRKAATKVAGQLGVYIEEKSLTLMLDWLFKASSDQDVSVKKGIMSALGELVQYLKEENHNQIICYLEEIVILHQSKGIRKVALETFRKLGPYVNEGALGKIFHLIQMSLVDSARFDQKEVFQAAVGILYEIAPFVREKTLGPFLEGIKAALEDNDNGVRNISKDALERLCFSFKDNKMLILNWIEGVLPYKDQFLRESLISLLSTFSTAVNEDQLIRTRVFNLIERAFKHEASRVRKSAAWVLKELGLHVKGEAAHQLYSYIKTALRDADEDVMKAGREALSSLSHQFLLTKLCSQTPDDLEAQTLILNQFIHQSIPLYLVKKGKGYFLHINDTCCTEISFKQFTHLLHFCAAYMKNAWEKDKVVREEVICPIM